MTSQTPGTETSVEGAGGSAWRRLALAGRPRPTKANLLATLLALSLGFAIAVQVRQTSLEGLETLREGDLVRLLDAVNADGARLSQEISALELERQRLGSASGTEEAAAAARARLDSLGILAGTVAATGPGIELTITDPSSKYTAAMLLDTVQELRDAGAEAIQINDARVIASTSFADLAGRQIGIDGATLTRPYVVIAIGEAKTLAAAMEIPGGVGDSARRVGASVRVDQRERVEVTALRAVQSPRYARPAAQPSPTP
jgi:uncharacterized protein YlxW (UPF0749 family)